MTLIELALAEVKATDKPVFSVIATKHSINANTPRRRAKGTQLIAAAKAENQSLLLKQQEKTLLQHINILSKRRLLPTPAILRNLVFKIL